MYEAMRVEYRPDKVRVLLIAEAPPQEGRFFYNVETSEHDSLYLETMGVLFHGLSGEGYGEGVSHSRAALRSNKADYLRRLQTTGFWLQDAVSIPLPVGMSNKEKGRRIRGNLPRLVQIITLCDPDWCILISRGVYDNLAEELKRAGAPIINERPIPFPAYGHQRTFRQGLSGLLLRHGILPLPPYSGHD
ncbi:MAG: hypothetical protein QUS33_05560 [Dehalococcoidia bacterium]|nr:hypothetical protein [Dehalococcoidia bacterium]